LKAQEFFRAAWQHLESRTTDERFSALVGQETLSVTLPHHPTWGGCLSDSFVSIGSWRFGAGIQIQVFCREELQGMPSFPLDLDRESVLGKIEPWCSKDFLALASEHGMMLADKTENRALVFYEDIGSIPMWDRCAPFRTILGFFSSDFNAQMVHGAALVVGHRACLLCGQGGSGKSSTAMVSTGPESEMDFLSEDYTLVGNDLRVYPLYRSLKVDASGLERMPWLSSFNVIGDQDGKTCYLYPRDRMGAATDLAAIIWPDRNSDQVVSALSKINVLKHLAPSTLFQNPAASRDDFANLVRLCRSLSSYKLGLGDSPSSAEVEERLEHLMSEVIPT
jgi:hypothetical protein